MNITYITDMSKYLAMEESITTKLKEYLNNQVGILKHK